MAIARHGVMQGGERAYPPVSAAVGDSIQRLIDALARVLPAVLGAIVVLVVFWAMATFARNTARAMTGFMRDQTRRLLVIQVTYYFVWIVGVIVALDSIGMNLATQIRTYDGRLVLVPNGEVFTSRITNNTASPLRQASVYVYLDYREDTVRALALILETVKAVPGVAAFPVPWIGIRDFQLDAVQLETRFWAESNRAQLTGTASAARMAIVRALKAAGIRFPDRDERTVRIAAPLAAARDAADPPRQ